MFDCILNKVVLINDFIWYKDKNKETREHQKNLAKWKEKLTTPKHIQKASAVIDAV